MPREHPEGCNQDTLSLLLAHGPAARALTDRPPGTLRCRPMTCQAHDPVGLAGLHEGHRGAEGVLRGDRRHAIMPGMRHLVALQEGSGGA
jgi:hypothetical protein